MDASIEQEEDVVVQSRKGVKIALDYIIENESIAKSSGVEYNQYIASFCQNPWLNEIREIAYNNSGIKKLLNHRSLKKEISELYGVLRLVELMLRRVTCSTVEHEDSDDDCILDFKLIKEYQHQLVFYDICSGKGIASFFISLLFPKSQIIMIDFDASIKMEHIEISQCSNITFIHMDIYHNNFKSYILSNTLLNIHNNKLPIIFGLHLCGTLTTHLIHIYQYINTLSILVISPCCMPKHNKTNKLYNNIRNKTKLNKWSSYNIWCLYTYTLLQLHYDQYVNNIYHDINVISDKSIFVYSFKKYIISTTIDNNSSRKKDIDLVIENIKQMIV
jgi:hypothetical protein